MEESGRWTRVPPPTHFVLKFESFSTLSASSMSRYESPSFEAADTKWKLVIYPNGNKASGGKDHISVYIALADKACLSLKKEISVTFRLFVFDQIRAKYLTVEGSSSFNAVKYEYGMDKFLPLVDFKDAAKGYLMNGTCLFGAEVFLIKHTYEMKCLSMVGVKSKPFTFTWKIDQYSKMEDKQYLSKKFTVWDYDWKLQFYPKGYKTGKGNSISLYLYLFDSETSKLAEGNQIIVERKFRLVDQLNKNHYEMDLTNSYASTNTSWGTHHFRSFADLKNEANGYLVNDSFILEVDVIILGSTTNSA